MSENALARDNSSIDLSETTEVWVNKEFIDELANVVAELGSVPSVDKLKHID